MLIQSDLIRANCSCTLFTVKTETAVLCTVGGDVCVTSHNIDCVHIAKNLTGGFLDTVMFAGQKIQDLKM